jgi:hypothetical protein
LAPLAIEAPPAAPVPQAETANGLLSLEAPPSAGLAPAPVVAPVDPLALVLTDNPNVQVLDIFRTWLLMAILEV